MATPPSQPEPRRVLLTFVGNVRNAPERGDQRPALALVQVVGLLNNVNSHLGYELLPAWWVRAPLLSWSASATYHNLHHQRLNGNYGLFFRFWDRALGTELTGYEDAFVDRRWPEHLPPP